MPNYVYKCMSCEKVISIFHSFSEKATDCGLCSAKESLRRDYSTPFNLASKPIEKKTKVGEVVRQHIEDTREEIKQEKERLEKECFDD